MNRSVSPPKADSQGAPGFDLAPNAHRIASDQEALAIARELAPAKADDPTAIDYNPAGLAEQRGTRVLLDEYRTVMLLRLDVAPAQAGEWLTWSRRLAGIALDLERELFLDGRYRAFAIAGGRPCDLDEPCGRPERCDVRALVRPGPAGCGIDVFATAANAGWTLDVVRAPDDPYHLFALVLVD